MSSVSASATVTGRMPWGAKVGEAVEAGADVTVSVQNPTAVDAEVSLSLKLSDNQGKLSASSSPVSKTIYKNSRDSFAASVRGSATYDAAAWVGVTCQVTLYDRSSGTNALDETRDAGHFNVV
jgi:hypothetical protein